MCLDSPHGARKTNSNKVLIFDYIKSYVPFLHIRMNVSILLSTYHVSGTYIISVNLITTFHSEYHPSITVEETQDQRT